MFSNRFLRPILVISVCLVSHGCFGVRAPEKPELSPAESAATALQEYDSDGDSLISEEEAESAPGLLAAFKKVDADSDGQLSADEIERRINYYKTATSWVVPGQCKILYRGKPLPNANVEFEPEALLGASFQPCSGVTDDQGIANISRPGADIQGIFLGFYRVRITKEKKNGEEMLKAKYNTETTLGFEATNDTPDQSNYDAITFSLK